MLTKEIQDSLLSANSSFGSSRSRLKTTCCSLVVLARFSLRQYSRDGQHGRYDELYCCFVCIVAAELKRLGYGLELGGSRVAVAAHEIATSCFDKDGGELVLLRWFGLVAPESSVSKLFFCEKFLNISSKVIFKELAFLEHRHQKSRSRTIRTSVFFMPS